MAKRMTEAARLYWKDIDVLEEARGELVEYLETIWSQAWEKLQSSWEHVEDDSEPFKIEHWADRQRPGRWYLNVKQGQPANFEIEISDPRRSDDWRFYNIRILCAQTHQKRLEKLASNAKGSITSIASAHGVSLEWESRNNMLHKADIEAIADDADSMSDRVVEGINKMLEWINESYSWMFDRKKEETQTETGQTESD